MALPVGTPSEHIVDDSALTEFEVDASALFKRQPPSPVMPSIGNTSEILMPKAETESHILENLTVSQQVPDEQSMQVGADQEFDFLSDVAIPPIDYDYKDSDSQKAMDIIMTDEDNSPSMVEADQLSPSTVDTPVLEETSVELPVVPPYVELTEEQQRDLRKLAIKRIIDSYKQLSGLEFMQTRMALLSRLVAQVGVDSSLDWLTFVEFNCFYCFLFWETLLLFLTIFYLWLLLRMSTGCVFTMYANFVKEIMTSFICEIIIYLLFKINNF